MVRSFLPVGVSDQSANLTHVLSAGNKRFRDAVTNALESYTRAASRYEKSLVVHSIVESIRATGGRFLKRDSKTNRWYELSDQQAKEKAGHAVRDALNSLKGTKKSSTSSVRSRYSDFDYSEYPKSESPTTNSAMLEAIRISEQVTFPGPPEHQFHPTASHVNPVGFFDDDFSEDPFLDRINAVLGPLPPGEEDPISGMLRPKQPQSHDQHYYL